MTIARQLTATDEKLDVAKKQINNVVATVSMVLIYVLYAVMLYTNRGLEHLIGPVLAVAMVAITFTDYYYIPFAVIMVSPHAIGTAFMGRVSFFFLLGALFVLRLFVIKFATSVTLKDIFWLFVAMFNCLHLYIFLGERVGTTKLAYMAIFFIWAVHIMCEIRKNNEFMRNVFLAYAITVTTNGLVSFISGSATKYANADRMGMIGVGSNDPNIAAMHITLAVAIILSTAHLNSWIKIACLASLALSLSTTVSISGFLGVALVVLAYIAFSKKDSRNIRFVVLLIICALLIIYIFPMFSTIQNEDTGRTLTSYIEYYQDKLYEKFTSFATGDFENATSGRTFVAGQNIAFFLEQSPIRQLFGGNHVDPLGILVSHNSFADNLLRFGFLGSLVIFIMMAVSFVKCFKFTVKNSNCTWMLCKLCMLYWSLSLSMFDGNGAVLWFSLLLLC